MANSHNNNKNDSNQQQSSTPFLELAGSKLRSQLSTRLNESASSGCVSDFAKKQLEKAGWKEGQGLGKNGNGITTHIRAIKRTDEQGGLGNKSSLLGTELTQSIGNEWWKHSVGDTLAKLGIKKQKEKDKKKKKKKKTTTTTPKQTKKPKVFTDEELFRATGGARFGMRAQSRQEGKWKRTEGLEEQQKQQEEQNARNNIEWDGMTVPKVLLSSSSTSSSSSNKNRTKRKRNEEEEEEKDEKEDTVERIQKKKKKKIKKKKKKIKKD